MILQVYENDELACELELTGPLQLGRQREGEPAPYETVPATDATPARLVIARLSEKKHYSRQHVLLDLLPGGKVRLTNGSQAVLALPDGLPALAPEATTELAPPFRVRLGSRTLSVGGEPALHRLHEQTLRPGSGPRTLCALPQELTSLPPSQLDQLIGWLQTAMGVVQSAIGADDYLVRAANALVEAIGLHSGRALLLRGDSWQVIATRGAQTAEWRPSRDVMAALRREERTIWRHSDAQLTGSMEGLHTVVASPLFDGGRQVIGALYGELRQGGSSGGAGDKLEALLVELLACGVSAGLARHREQSARIEAETLFNQFFTPRLAEQLRRHPELLDGRRTDVTVLFCDIRGFSKVSEKYPDESLKWVSAALNELSPVVLEREGVLVDYVGDELLAMWGAPIKREDDASRAVEAALAMLRYREKLDREWRERLGGFPTELGIGVNTGKAQVGNTGSASKFKYGPLGNEVNLASRVQGLTKYLGCRLLVTGKTRAALDTAPFLSRRVCTARVVNIDEPVELYEIDGPDSERGEFFAMSEKALDSLEANDFAAAAGLAGRLLQEYGKDGPSLLTLSRASQALMQDGAEFDPVWRPPGK